MSTAPERCPPVEGDRQLLDMAERLLAHHCPPEVAQRAEAGEWPGALWGHVAATGLGEIGVADGPAVGGVLDAVEILIRAGASAAPVPLAEAGMLGGWLLATARLDAPAGILTVPVPHPDDTVRWQPERGGVLEGTFASVPWGRHASHVVAVVEADGREWCACLPLDAATVEHAHDIAGDPRDIVHVDATAPAAAVPPGTARRLHLRGGLGRAALMAGAMARSVELASEYARQRRQFGKPIAEFQAVQQMLAIAAGAAASAHTAVLAAANAVATGPDDPHRRVAVARAVGHQAAETVAKHCHQVFGAIGVTKEHELHLRTRRLWSWDSEWGSPAAWASDLTEAVLAVGPDAMWPLLCDLSVAGVGRS